MVLLHPQYHSKPSIIKSQVSYLYPVAFSVFSQPSLSQDTVCALISESTEDEWVIQPHPKLPHILNGKFALQGNGLRYMNTWHIQRVCAGDSSKMCDQLIIRPQSAYPTPLPNGMLNIAYTPESSVTSINTKFEFGKGLDIRCP